MFNTEIYITTFIYIVIISINIIFISIDFPKNNHPKFYYRILTLLFLGVLYNIISGIIPDANIPIEILAQNIIAFTVGISSAFYFFYFLNKEYEMKPIAFVNIDKILIIMTLGFIFLFIIPYIITNDLNLARNIFLLLPCAILILSLLNQLKNSWNKFKEEVNAIVKTHILIGLFSMLSILSLPATILIFGDNQLIEHSAYSFGFILICVDYHLYHKKRIKKISHSPISESTPIKSEANPLLEFTDNKDQNIKSQKKDIPNKKKIDLATDTVDQILKKLADFETNKGYLCPNLKLTNLAKEFSSNNSYLSKIINFHKGKNFSQYINDMRITYVENRLRKDKRFRKYTIKAISEEAGFSNTEAFSHAFYKKTGLKPTHFIKSLN